MSALMVRGYPATDEMIGIINAVKRGVPFVSINAFAGTGKTSTLVGISEAMPPLSVMLYLTFSEAMAKSAKSVFKNVQVQTAHAFARPYILERGEGLKNKYTATEVSAMFDISMKEAYAVITGFEWFCNSDEASVSDNLPYKTLVEELFYKMESGEILKTHSYYLKRFQLNLINGVPMKLKKYDLIMLDEYQDTNEVTRSIFEHLSAKQRIAVGDTHQSIFGFRGAVNIMSSLGGEKHYLTNSFRFGKEIADRASLFLNIYKGEEKKITGKGTLTAAYTAASLTRTNASLVEIIMNFIKTGTYFKTIRDPQFIFGLPLSIAMLNAGKNEVFSKQYNYLKWEYDKFKKFSRGASGFADYLIEVGKENDDSEMVFGGKMAIDYPLSSIEAALEKTNENNRNEAPCQYFAGTGHSSKGLEFDVVKINDDFRDLFEIIAKWAIESRLTPDGNDFLGLFKRHIANGAVPSNVIEEFNLFYVAITRAKVKVYMADSLGEIFSSNEKINEAIQLIYLNLKNKLKQKG